MRPTIWRGTVSISGESHTQYRFRGNYTRAKVDSKRGGANELLLYKVRKLIVIAVISLIFHTLVLCGDHVVFTLINLWADRGGYVEESMGRYENNILGIIQMSYASYAENNILCYIYTVFAILPYPALWARRMFRTIIMYNRLYPYHSESS